MTAEIEFFRTDQGGRVYRLPIDLFPFLKGFAHLVIADEIVALIDVGSGFGDSNDQLDEGLSRLPSEFDEHVGWEAITHVLITHGHIDHFGGLHFVRERTSAPIGIHDLDARVLAHYEERVSVIAKRLGQYLMEAGVDDEYRQELMNTYLINKYLFSSLPPDFTFESIGMRLGRLRMLHVPGHCPGQVVIRLDDVLFSADHILPDVTPHQAPERLTLNMGLGHYLDSLEKTRSRGDGVHRVLGGHGAVMVDLEKRIDEIEESHRERLIQILDYAMEPRTLAELSRALYPEVEGYDKLLAVEEAGAHVEYLMQLGFLRIDNLEDLEGDGIVPLRYRQSEHLESHAFPFTREEPLPSTLKPPAAQ